MAKFTWLSIVVGVLIWCAGATGAATAATPQAAPKFTECPHVGADTGCQYLIKVTDLATSMATDAGQPAFANNLAGTHEKGTPTDALIGVVNNSSRPLTRLNISGPITFEFDGDGICDNASGPVPAGCERADGSTTCGALNGGCSFPPAPGEPANYIAPGAVAGTLYFPNGDVPNGYEGPTTWFSNVPSSLASGTVNFAPALAPGASTYFSLEGTPTNFPVTTGVSGTQAAAGMRGSRLYVPSGINVVTRGTVSGGTGRPKGSLTFDLFRSSSCTARAAISSKQKLGARPTATARLGVRSPGTYYAQIRYSGDSKNAAAQTNCGSAMIIVPRRGPAGLPVSRRCVSTLRGSLHLGRTRVRSALVFANGKLVERSTGRFRLRIRKRTAISVIASTQPRAFAVRGTPGRLVQQSRTYRSC